MKQRTRQRFNHMSALVSNYKGDVDRGASQILVGLVGKPALSISSLASRL